MNSLNPSEISFKNTSNKYENSFDNTSTSSTETIDQMIIPLNNNSQGKNFGKSLERKIQSHSYTPIMINSCNNSKDNNFNDINVKSGCTDLIHEETSPETNAQVEFLYSRDLFLFEYRKRPDLKSEGTQSDNRRTGTSRIFRF